MSALVSLVVVTSQRGREGSSAGGESALLVGANEVDVAAVLAHRATIGQLRCTDMVNPMPTKGCGKIKASSPPFAEPPWATFVRLVCAVGGAERVIEARADRDVAGSTGRPERR